MRIAVLGANGQVGAPVLRRLLQDYPQELVVGCVREESLASVQGDADFLQCLFPFNPFKDDWVKLGTVDVLINCIGIIKETTALDFAHAHIGLTELMLQHRELMGNPKLIQISALGADVASPSRFLRTKGLADAALLKHADTVVVRPSIVCTPGTMLSRKLQLLRKLCHFTFGVLPFPEKILKTKLQPVLVEDVTELISRLCLQKREAGVVEIGGGDIFTIRQLLEMVPTCRKIMPISQSLFQKLLPVVASLFPSLIDKEQQVLLQQDNIAKTGISERILGRSMASTISFWRQELK